jgi:hypothetical protein
MRGVCLIALACLSSATSALAEPPQLSAAPAVGRASITGGSIDNTPIGSKTMSSGQFNSLTTTTTTGGTGKFSVVPSEPYTPIPSGQQLDSFVFNAAGTATAPAGNGTPTTYTAATGYNSIRGAQNNYMWGGLFVADFSGTGGTGQHVGVYAQALRRTYASQTTAVSATLGSPGTTVPVASVLPFQTNSGMPVSSSNPLPIQINGKYYLCVGVSGTSGPGAITTAGAVSTRDATSGNVVIGLNNPGIWAGTFESTDLTGQSSSKTGDQLSAEFDLKANGDDDANPPYGRRQILSIVSAIANPAGPANVVGIGAGFYATENSSFKQAIHVAAPYSVSAFDTRQGTQMGGNTIWLADGQTIALDTAGTRTLSYDAASGKLFVKVRGTPVFSIDASGNVRASGTITGNTTP